MSRIYVAGGGNAKDSFLLDRDFVKSLNNNRILYIPVGLERSIAGYEGCYAWLSNTLSVHTRQKLDITMVIDLKRGIYENICNYAGVYIGGALNTYRLMKVLVSTGFDKKIKNYLRGKGNLYGGSSGGIVFGENISTFGKERDQCGIGEQGLNLINGYSFYCHFTDNKVDEVFQFSRKKQTSVIALPEDSGIVCENGVAVVVGYSKIAVVHFGSRKLKYFKPNESFRV